MSQIAARPTADPTTNGHRAAHTTAPAQGSAGPQGSAGGPSGTPRRLRIAMALGVLGCLLFGALGLSSGFGQSGALEDTAVETRQLVLLQSIRANLVQADAEANNAFLVGGLEPPEQRATYDALLQSASQGLSQAADGATVETEAVGSVIDAVVRYNGLVEQARANNRQGFPVGSAYLRQASTTLRESTLPALTSLAQDSADHVATDNRAISSARTATGVGAGIAVVVVVGVLIWHARRFRRYLNTRIVGGLVLIVAGATAAGVVFGSVVTEAEEVRETSYAEIIALTQVRAQAFDAKSRESFTLIARGSGEQYEAEAQAALDEADRLLRSIEDSGVSEVRTRLDAWRAKHDEIRTLDDDGDWDGAVELATSRGADSPTATFDAFDELTAERLDLASQDASSALEGKQQQSVIMGWIVLLIGLVASGLVWSGIQQRLGEYR